MSVLFIIEFQLHSCNNNGLKGGDDRLHVQGRRMLCGASFVPALLLSIGSSEENIRQQIAKQYIQIESDLAVKVFLLINQ